jgi:hypothetical protein
LQKTETTQDSDELKNDIQSINLPVAVSTHFRRTKSENALTRKQTNSYAGEPKTSLEEPTPFTKSDPSVKNKPRTEKVGNYRGGLPARLPLKRLKVETEGENNHTSLLQRLP